MKAPTQPISQQIMSGGRFSGLFPGWGDTRVIACKHSLGSGHETVADTHEKSLITKNKYFMNRHHLGLGTLFSLSIGGNDLLSSSLYTAGICATYSGKVNIFYLY
jgi:hypothetical protein